MDEDRKVEETNKPIPFWYELKIQTRQDTHKVKWRSKKERDRVYDRIVKMWSHVNVNPEKVCDIGGRLAVSIKDIRYVFKLQYRGD